MKLELDLDEAMVARVSAELAHLKANGIEATFTEVAFSAMHAGLCDRERVRGTTEAPRLVRDLAVHELAELMGVYDLAAVRASQRRAKEASAESMATALVQLRDAKGLAACSAPMRITTCQELENWAQVAHQTFHANGPGLVLVVIGAWCNEQSQTYSADGKGRGVDPRQN